MPEAKAKRIAKEKIMSNKVILSQKNKPLKT